ncbi:hypothetical protein BSL78_26495 [Apostichopus japonicus]|uniref:Uncharacterized protein n=1 Tax=Stichopus japonicus TaxID=307972 RepID=A0A2G8JLQ6_STIJA|nr:hypothetical protein BSL78_26495 [Apostichopus japonicus]
MKNIPIPTATPTRILIEKVENVIKRMRWKASFFLKTCNNNEEDDEEDDEHHPAHTENFGFKSKKCPPQIEELRLFEDDLLRMIENVKFKKSPTNSKTNSEKTSAGSRNLPNCSSGRQNQKPVRDRHPTTRKTPQATHHKELPDDLQAPATESKPEYREKLGIDNRMESMATKQAFITLKDTRTTLRTTYHAGSSTRQRAKQVSSARHPRQNKQRHKNRHES